MSRARGRCCNGSPPHNANTPIHYAHPPSQELRIQLAKKEYQNNNLLGNLSFGISTYIRFTCDPSLPLKKTFHVPGQDLAIYFFFYTFSLFLERIYSLIVSFPKYWNYIAAIILLPIRRTGAFVQKAPIFYMEPEGKDHQHLWWTNYAGLQSKGQDEKHINQQWLTHNALIMRHG